MADTSRTAIWALGGAIVGWLAGRGTGTNYGGLANLLGTVTPEVVPAVAAWGHGRGHGHGAAPFIMYDTERRIAHLEAAEAASSVAIRKDAEISAIRDRCAAEVTDGKIYRATCHKVDGELYLPTRRLGCGYRDEPRVLESHNHHCGGCGNWY